MKASLQTAREAHKSPCLQATTKPKFRAKENGTRRERKRERERPLIHGDKFDTCLLPHAQLNEARPYMSMLSTCGAYVVTLRNL